MGHTIDSEIADSLYAALTAWCEYLIDRVDPSDPTPEARALRLFMSGLERFEAERYPMATRELKDGDVVVWQGQIDTAVYRIVRGGTTDVYDVERFNHGLIEWEVLDRSDIGEMNEALRAAFVGIGRANAINKRCERIAKHANKPKKKRSKKRGENS